MGYYLNPSNRGFAESLRSEIYVDKTGIITYTNKALHTEQKYVCISRPRRFGKTMAAKMLAAYYSLGCDSGQLFMNLAADKAPSFKDHLNKYNVIFLNMQEFLSKYKSVEAMIKKITEKVNLDISEEYPNFDFRYVDDLSDSLNMLFKASEISVIFIADEWDCVFREYKTDKAAQKTYLDFLRNLLKDREYVALAYMTGILPIKKYGSHSALNMFDEYSMTNPEPLAEYVGFTQGEVKSLCEKYQMDYENMAEWYDGYQFRGIGSIYNPKSVVASILRRCFDNYWSKTETYEALSIYIEANFDHLKDTVIELLAGEKKRIDVSSFTNDMVTFKSYNDVLTLLIHLGYLGYDSDTREVFIPNKEISDEFVTAVKNTGWDNITAALKASDDLLKATWRGDAQTVAQCIEQAHNETSIIKYNNENALACVISLAYYSARQYYSIVREMPAGKGFADLVFLPRKNHMDKPAMIIELKWDKSAAGAIRQIESKQYLDVLKDYKDNVLLIGINYDLDTKHHECAVLKSAGHYTTASITS